MKSVSSSLTSTSNAIEHRCDVLIIGSGAAGLSLALKLADHCQVIVLSKSDRNEGSTRYAQGGIAAVFDEQDSIDAHVKDTLAAGAGLCEEPAVRFTAERAKASLEWLISYGVPFDTEKSESGEERFTLPVRADTATGEFFTLQMPQAKRFKLH